MKNKLKNFKKKLSRHTNLFFKLDENGYFCPDCRKLKRDFCKYHNFTFSIWANTESIHKIDPFTEQDE